MTQEQLPYSVTQPATISELLPQEAEFYCIADASWKSPTDKVGIGWSLHSREGTLRLHGSSAINSTNSPLEAEAMAMLLAIQRMNILSYKNVAMLGDNAELIKELNLLQAAKTQELKLNGATIIIQDSQNSSKKYMLL
ncbi:hypothetical protein Bca52824_006876 [Brassica carinata]|uniref:RNase H type-1 domain-containing protein n=1 Tax=Brassica carinata TaxID=52824 RepID=A0A8X7W8V5_BRACI|nr:hypothetical protein Bca52824_006876 [Brassica carinata]